MVEMVHTLSVKYNKISRWKYYATSHGKGVVDGIGGSVKSLGPTTTTAEQRTDPDTGFLME